MLVCVGLCDDPFCVTKCDCAAITQRLQNSAVENTARHTPASTRRPVTAHSPHRPPPFRHHFHSSTFGSKSNTPSNLAAAARLWATVARKAAQKDHCNMEEC